MRTTPDEVSSMIQNSHRSPYGADVERVHPVNSIGACLQIEELSSKDVDSPQTEETYARQWLYNVAYGISALVKEFPIYIKCPDGLFPEQVLPPRPSVHRDSCGLKGHNAQDVLGCSWHSTEPDFADGTWMTVHIRIPQTILGRKCRLSIPHQSDGGNIRGQTEITTGTNNHHSNEDKYGDRFPHDST